MFKFRLALLAIVLFGVSLVFSFGEMRYMMFGHTTDAPVIKVSEVTSRGRYGSVNTKLRVQYQLEDVDGTKRMESDTVPTNWPLGTEKTVAVQYIPKSDSSRLAGNTHTGWVFLFGAFVIGIAGAGVWFLKFR